MTSDLHARLLTLDSHIDIPWPDRDDFLAGSPARQVDLPRLVQGGMKAVCLAAYIPQTERSDEAREAAWTRAQAMLDTICGLTGPGAALCTTAQAVSEAVARGDVAIVPAMENGHGLGGDPERVAVLAGRGVRYITLTHNGHNDLADAAIPLPALGDGASLHGGLSALGRQVIARMNASGILIDVSHAAKSTMMQAVDLADGPVIASHSCARALCDHPRNLDDEQLFRLRDSGGVIQITAMSGFLKPSREGRANVDDLAHHVAYVADRIGLAHVGLSSDFDGGGGIEGWTDAAQAPAVTEALLRRGMTEADLAAIWGGNFLRVMGEAEKF
ncbi:dipeptidase [Swaminathania salitolerans]|uniref:Dipeptidase n=1 Tax=Swaminathania salitolerans TaxID=182838 RepID=A0A511BP02_9PROT|nr:dipeptidase [Swaminathania salitolerans]GBQ15306.1 dipeptidase [Swaminathania salitolerans LMG 21291]GEL02060.1 dipeptidase [Swaminathania salitolerans]